MSDVEQAAERLRRWKQDVFTCDMEQVGKDRALLADAYLAEHLPDDGESITEAWLREQGYEYIEQYDYLIAECRNGSKAIIRLCESVFISNYWVSCKKRGQLRQLLRVLGSEVTA